MGHQGMCVNAGRAHCKHTSQASQQCQHRDVTALEVSAHGCRVWASWGIYLSDGHGAPGRAEGVASLLIGMLGSLSCRARRFSPMCPVYW